MTANRPYRKILIDEKWIPDLVQRAIATTSAQDLASLNNGSSEAVEAEQAEENIESAEEQDQPPAENSEENNEEIEPDESNDPAQKGPERHTSLETQCRAHTLRGVFFILCILLITAHHHHSCVLHQQTRQLGNTKMLGKTKASTFHHFHCCVIVLRKRCGTARGCQQIE